MSKSYYKLRDPGSTFYDIAHAQGVVADRIEPLENTVEVTKAERDGVLIKLDKKEGKSLYVAQQEAAKQGIVNDGDEDATEEDNLKAAEAKLKAEEENRKADAEKVKADAAKQAANATKGGTK